MEDAIVLMRQLLAGEEIEVGAERPAYLPFHRPVPVWLTAGGPRTLEMGDASPTAYSCASAQITRRLPTRLRRFDVGLRTPAVIRSRYRWGSSFTQCSSTIRDDALTMGKAMAAGYFEYSPMLFEPCGLSWDGPDPEILKHERNVWPDFHHDPT